MKIIILDLRNENSEPRCQSELVEDIFKQKKSRNTSGFFFVV